MVLKCSYLSQKIKWKRTLGKPTASIVKPILIWVHQQPIGGWTLEIKGYELSIRTRLKMSIVGATIPMMGSLHRDIDSLRTMVVHLSLHMKWSNCP